MGIAYLSVFSQSFYFANSFVFDGFTKLTFPGLSCSDAL